MSGRRLGLNLALVLALVLVAWLIVEARRPPPLVAGRPPAELSHIAVDERFSLRRREDRWWLRSPRRLPASEEQMQRLLDFLGTPVDEALAVAELATAPLGLDAPRLRLTLDGEPLVFGDLDPLSKRRYLRRGDQVLLVLDPVSSLLGGPWWNFVDRRLVPPDVAVRAVILPDGRRIDDARLRDWQRLRARIVTPEPAAADSAPLVRMITTAGERRLRLRRTAPSGLWDPAQELLYQMPDEWLDELIGEDADRA